MTELDFDIFPMQVQYRSNQLVRLKVEAMDSFAPTDMLDVSIWHLGKMIRSFRVTGANLVQSGGEMNIGSYPKGGYHVIAQVPGGHAQTAFDVRARWKDAPRYGFLAGYDVRDSYEDIQHFFCKFHLNVVQFYDWMERHDALVPRGTEFTDPMGRKLVTAGIIDRLDSLREIGASSMAYAAVYASLADYAKSHQDEGIYDNQGTQYSLIDIFYLMDITSASSWRKHILSEFHKVIDFGFDGLHLDQYGYPKTALRRDGSALSMDEAYASFIEACRNELEDDAGLIFNHVSTFPLHRTHDVGLDAIYVEIWPPMTKYRHLAELISRIRILTRGQKQAILAAYLKPFREQQGADSDAMARSALLLTAVIYASGGYHLVLGESGGMLTEAYYPDFVPMPPCLISPLRKMYDTVTADAELLSAPDVVDVTWSYAGGINDTVVVRGAPTSVEPDAGSVWIRVTTSRAGMVVHLINLLWLSHDAWNAIHYEPFCRTPEISLRIEWNHPVTDVFVQYAEIGHWHRTDASWQPHVRGNALEVLVAPFDVWTMVFVPYETDRK